MTECPRCAEMKPLLQSASDQLLVAVEEKNSLAGLLARQEATINRLRAERRKEMEDAPESKELRAIFNYWREQTGHTKAKWDPAGVRAEKIRARLRVFTPEDLRKAIRGAAAFPYVLDGKRVTEVKKGDPEDFRYDDIKTIFKDEEIVGRMMRLADRVGPKLRKATPEDWRVRLLRRFGLLSEFEEREEGRRLAACPVCGAVLRISDVLECYAGCASEAIDRALIALDAQDDQFRMTEAA